MAPDLPLSERRIHVLIPALNEAANIERVLEPLAARPGVELILVDDGSSDGTSEVARSAPAAPPLTVLRHDAPRGPGAAFATGFEHLAGALAPDDLVLTLEADNTSRLEILDLMLGRLHEQHDAILASPYMYGGGVVHTRPHRVLISHLGNSVVKGALGVRGILTVSSFYRLYTAGAITRLQRTYGPRIVERSGFECMVEITLKMIYLGMSLSEVPMVLDTSRRQGRSKMKIAPTALGYFALARHKRRWQRQAGMAL